MLFDLTPPDTNVLNARLREIRRALLSAEDICSMEAEPLQAVLDADPRIRVQCCTVLIELAYLTERIQESVSDTALRLARHDDYLERLRHQMDSMLDGTNTIQLATGAAAGGMFMLAGQRTLDELRQRFLQGKHEGTTARDIMVGNAKAATVQAYLAGAMAALEMTVNGVRYLSAALARTGSETEYAAMILEHMTWLMLGSVALALYGTDSTDLKQSLFDFLGDGSEPPEPLRSLVSAPTLLKALDQLWDSYAGEVVAQTELQTGMMQEDNDDTV